MKNNVYNTIKKTKESNKNLGITLIALVITIVILLIISTAAITLLINNNLMGNAKTAVDKYNNEVDKENYELARLTNSVENLQSSREGVQAANPTGTIISYMGGTTAPEGYLACDGSELNIADYPELAAQFEAGFGSKNYYGGDGTTTFKVPDLRGEFLRGTGTNGYASQGNGENVGVHQNGTEHPAFIFHNKALQISLRNYNASVVNRDYIGNADGVPYSLSTVAQVPWSNMYSGNTGGAYTSRPTNTSVLYCIKY